MQWLETVPTFKETATFIHFFLTKNSCFTAIAHINFITISYEG